MNASSSDACCGVSSWRAIPCGGGSVADLLRRQPVHLDAPRLGAGDGDAGAGERSSRSRVACGERTSTTLLRGARDEVVDARVGDQPAAADHDQVVGGERHLAHQVRGDEDRAALGGERLEQVADPVDALGVEPVDRLVEQHRRGSPSSAERDPEPLAHAERELAGALARDVVQADEVDHLVDPALGMPCVWASASRWLYAERPGVDGARLEQRADLVQRRGVVAVVACR